MISSKNIIMHNPFVSFVDFDLFSPGFVVLADVPSDGYSVELCRAEAFLDRGQVTGVWKWEGIL